MITKRERFEVIKKSEAESFGFDKRYGGYDGYLLIDNEKHTIVGEDGGEPEDQLLVRDLAWIPCVLNHLADDINSLRASLQKAERSLSMIDKICERMEARARAY